MAVILRDYQESGVVSVRLAYREGYKAIILVLSTGAGKCLARGTPVLMYDGTIKSVEDVAVGDILMGPDSSPRRVESLARGMENMYRVVPTKGDPYTVNESHILSLRITGSDKSRQRWIGGDGNYYRPGDICNITVADYLKSTSTFKHVAKGWRSPVDFPKAGKLPIPAYILGMWLGDGTTGKLSFTTADKELSNEIARYAKSVKMRCVVEQNSDWSVVIHLCSQGAKYGRGGSPFGNALRALGVFREKDIPLSYKTASRKDRLELLAGIIDTDGHYDGKGFSIAQKSEKLIDGIIFVARSLGFSAYKSVIQKKCHNNGVVGSYFLCNVSGEGIEQVPCRLRRKQAKPRLQKKNVLNVGISVEPVGVGDYYGFEISGADRLFMLGDFTVTHNTVIFSFIAKSAADKGKRVLILAHRDQLIKQASRKLKDYEVEHGIIMAGFTPNRQRRVQVASVQTLVRRIDKTKEWFKPDLIVIDEAHLSAANSYRKILDAYPDALILGVTGSPCRLDNKPLGKEYGGIYDHMIEGVSIRNLIDREFLVRPVVYAPAEQLDLTGIKKSMGDYDTQQLAAVVDKPKITGSAVAHYKKICPGAPAIAWCVTIEHAEHVAAEFRANGIKAMMLCGDDDSDVRDRALKGLETGDVEIICFVGILIEGVDCPAIGAIIMLRPSMSLSSYLQVIGRGLRPYVDRNGVKKEVCYILDHAGLTFRHGLADEERDWSLDWGEKKKGKKKPNDKPIDVVQCKGCFGVFAPQPVCPHCGKPVEIKQRKLEHVDGELHEITPEMAEAMRRKKKDEVKGAKTLEELQKIAAQRGYSQGWAQHTFDARQRIRQKYQPKPPAPPTLAELKTMSLDQLVIVGNQQGYPVNWASDFYFSQQALGG